MVNEIIWKSINGFDKYRISNKGDVKKLRFAEKMKNHTCKKCNSLIVGWHNENYYKKIIFCYCRHCGTNNYYSYGIIDEWKEISYDSTIYFIVGRDFV